MSAAPAMQKEALTKACKEALTENAKKCKSVPRGA